MHRSARVRPLISRALAGASSRPDPEPQLSWEARAAIGPPTVGWERGARRLGWHVAVRGSACGQRAEDRLRDLAAEPSAQQGSEVRFLLLAPQDGAWSWPRVLTCTPLGLTALERPRPRAGEAPRAAEGRASPSGVGAWDRRKVSARGAELGRHCPAHEEPMGILGAPGCTRRPTPGAPWPRLTRRPGFSRPLQPGEKLWSEALPPSPPNRHAQRSLRCLSPPAPAPWPSRALVTLRCGPVSITPAWCSATSSRSAVFAVIATTVLTGPVPASRSPKISYSTNSPS